MFSPPQSSSRRQLLAAGAGVVAGVGAGVVAGADAGADAPSPAGAGTASPSATRSGVADDAWPALRKGSSEAGAPARRNGSSDTAASARVAPEAHATPNAASASSSRRFISRRARSLRQEHLPLAVLADEGDVAGIALVALLAQDLQGRGVPFDLRFLDLELGPRDLFLHLLEAVLRLAEPHLRRQHSLLNERVAVDHPLGRAVEECLAPAL